MQWQRWCPDSIHLHPFAGDPNPSKLVCFLTKVLRQEAESHPFSGCILSRKALRSLGIRPCRSQPGSRIHCHAVGNFETFDSILLSPKHVEGVLGPWPHRGCNYRNNKLRSLGPEEGTAQNARRRLPRCRERTPSKGCGASACITRSTTN